MPYANNRKQPNLDEFVNRYSGIYEHSSWVAEETYEIAGEIDNVDELASVFRRCVDQATNERKLALIRAHPDLAGKAALKGELTEESSTEQASAGIDQCPNEEYQRFQDLNDRYKEKFGFPFVMAVRDSNRQEILAEFGRRLENDSKAEFDTAIKEIHKIARLRLQELDT